METALKGAGKLLSSIGYRAQLLVIGVLFPGVLITLELGAAWTFGDDGRRGEIYRWITQDLKAMAVPGLLLVVVALVVAYILGYIARDLTFKASNFWLRRGWPPSRPASAILAQMRIVHGAGEVDRILGRYRVFDLAAHEKSATTHGLPRLPDFYIREYCKLWLRTRAPALSTDGMEAEINMIIGFVIPVFLGIVPSLAFLPSRFGWLAAIGAALVCLLIGARLFFNINAVRCQETEEAVANFLFAHQMRLDAPPAKAPA